jgi:spore germination protein PC
MSNQNPYMWLNQMYRMIGMQSDKIMKLENEINALKGLIQEVQETPKQSIGTIEYKFDQLKVENLNGTLVIGLRHGETGEIEDMWVGDKHSENVPVGQPPNGDETRSESETDSIRRIVNSYIHNEITHALRDQASKQAVHLDSESLRSIVEDMDRQAGERIELYVKQGGSSAAVTRKIQSDLLMSVKSYLDYFHNKPDEQVDPTGER